jgi:transketolase
MAIAERALAHRFNRSGHSIVNHFTYALVSDGDLMEGISAEAASLAGHLKLGKLVYLYDSNRVTLDGPASLTFTTEDVGKRYEAYGWHVLHVADGDRDLDAIDRAIADARSETERPSLIIIRTTIGFGSPHKEGTASAHGSPLGAEEVALTKKALGWDPDRSFYIPPDAARVFGEAVAKGQSLQAEWQRRFSAFSEKEPELAAEWKRRIAGDLPDGWDRDVPRFEPGKEMATRVSAGKVLNAIAPQLPELIGGDADLSSSTKTSLDGEGSFDGQTGAGRNIHFGVREHAMGGIVNGMAYHGGVRAFAATFFCFSDYMRPAVRLAALSHLPVVFVWTHDSIGLGEDGPTHQAVEHLMSLRAMPNLHVVRPADANESAAAWRWAIERRSGPVALVLSRQGLPVLKADSSGLSRGAYVLSEATGGKPRAILIATGSEVALALEAQNLLAAEGIPCRVVSMPCWELFEEQGDAYRESVLPPSITARVAVEAGATLGWWRWVGDRGSVVGLDRFGASAPAEVNFEKLGFTPARLVEEVKRLVSR